MQFDSQASLYNTILPEYKLWSFQASEPGLRFTFHDISCLVWHPVLACLNWKLRYGSVKAESSLKKRMKPHIMAYFLLKVQRCKWCWYTQVFKLHICSSHHSELIDIWGSPCLRTRDYFMFLKWPSDSSLLLPNLKPYKAFAEIKVNKCWLDVWQLEHGI